MNINYLKEIVNVIAKHIIEKHDGDTQECELITGFAYARLVKKIRCNCGEEWELDLRRLGAGGSTSEAEQWQVFEKDFCRGIGKDGWLISKAVEELKKELELDGKKEKLEKNRFNNVTSYLRL